MNSNNLIITFLRYVEIYWVETVINDKQCCKTNTISEFYNTFIDFTQVFKIRLKKISMAALFLPLLHFPTSSQVMQ